MICQKCKQNEANTHYKQIVNGSMQEGYYCEGCAAELGLGTAFGGDMNLGTFLGDLLSTSAFHNSLAGVHRCKKCNCSYNDIVSSGRVGCADCYDEFLEQLLPSIENMHGKTKHIGKRSSGATVSNPVEEEQVSEIDKLKQQLKEAIRTQNFETAAVIRDKIREIEKEG